MFLISVCPSERVGVCFRNCTFIHVVEAGVQTCLVSCIPGWLLVEFTSGGELRALLAPGEQRAGQAIASWQKGGS